MIKRYRRAQMHAIWNDENRFKIWLEIEALALEKMEELGLAEKGSYAAVRARAKFSVARTLEIEQEVKHDVIAFLTNIAENVGPEARFMHRGMTSSDVLDTALAVQLKQAGEMIVAGLDKVIASVLVRANEFRYTVCVGRSHGIHAEPITFGLKLLTWYSELLRQKKRFLEALTDVSVGKIAGAVGTYASVPPEVEVHVLSALGLSAETVPTQIVHRDRHAAYFAALAGIGCTIERIATEVRHLQRTEVREAEEAFSSGQKGSSAMPHKRNPVLSENLCGLARLLRGYAVSAWENVALWHERDISHSSVERVIAPDACMLTDFMLARLNSLVSGLVVHVAQMRDNLELTRGLVFSGTLLIALADAGIAREDAYRLVQKHALAAWEGGATLKERVQKDAEITAKVSAEQLVQIFDIARHTRHVDAIFERAVLLGG